MEGSLRATIDAELAAARELVAALCRDPALAAGIEAVARDGAAVLRAGGTILFAGNGGSAADAQHLAGELVGRYAYDRPGLAAVALSSDASAITAIGNDYGFEHVFARQLEALARAGDLFVALSTSGRSANVIAGLKAARKRGAITAALTGRGGEALGQWCDHVLVMPSADTPRIQEGHKVVGHIICGLIEALCAPPGSAPSTASRSAGPDARHRAPRGAGTSEPPP